jgi:hypothetical protein
MSSLSTLEEYQSIDEALAFPKGAFIDSKFISAKGGDEFESVFTANLKRAHRMARAVRAGTVTVNCFGEGDISTLFGGYKQSGFGGHDNSIHAYGQYTEMKTIWIDISDQVVESSVD